MHPSDRYSTDPRDQQAEYGNWWKSFDKDKMTVTVHLCFEDDEGEDIEEDVEFPMKFEVCGICRGKGSHVNPSVDAHGISGEEFANDPDFYDSYRAGNYDVQCYRCGGQNVEPAINTETLSEDLKKKYDAWQEHMKAEAEYRAISAAERRMGA